MRIRIDTILKYILIISIVILSAGGTVFYYTPLSFRFITVAAFGASMILLVNKKKLILSKLTIWIFCLGIIGSYNNVDIERGLYTWYLYAMLMFTLLFIILSQYIDQWHIQLFKILFIAYMFYVVCTIWFYFDYNAYVNIAVKFFTNNRESMIRAYSRGCMTGFTSHYTMNGTLVSMAVIISGCALFIKTTRKRKIFNIIILMICIFALLLIGKRAHAVFTICALIGVFYIYMVNMPKKRLIFFTALILGIIASLVFIYFYVPALATFITRFQETSESGDITLGRTQMWEIAIQKFKENPVFGIGWGTIRNFNIIDTGVHNSYIQLLAETGIVGTVLYVTWFIYIFICTVKRIINIRKERIVPEENEEFSLLLSLAIQIFFLLYCLTENPLVDHFTYVPYYIAQAICINYSRKEIVKQYD